MLILDGYNLPKYEFQSITAEGGATIVNDNNEKLTASYNEEVGQNISLNDNNNLKAFPSDIDISTSRQQPLLKEIPDVYKVPLTMEKEFTAIRGAFGTMCAEITKLLLKHGVSLGNMKRFCRFTFNKPASHHMINECQTIEDVIVFVSNKCTLINITYLEELIKYCQIDADAYLLKYQVVIDKFKKKIKEKFPFNQSLLPNGSSPPLSDVTITFKMTWDPKDRISLDDITALLTDAFEELCTSVNVLEVKPSNSVDIICSFSSELTGLLIYHAVKNLKILKKKGLLELTIGYCTIWKRSDEVE
jgi:hypothetical protein